MPRPLAPHGTVAAYKRHLKLRDEPCDACRDAKRAARRDEYESAKSQQHKSGDSAGSSAGTSEDIADLADIARTLSVSMRAVAEDAPEKVAPLARELRATLLAMNAGSEKPKELSLAEQLAEARAARASRAAG
jgi:hypothetical protein